MRRGLDLMAVAAAGVALALAGPGGGGTLEDRVVAAAWLAAAALWACLAAVGAVHWWATRTDRVRWRRLTGALLPRSVRQRVEHLAVAGLCVVPVAACTVEGPPTTAPVLVLEGSTPLEPAPVGSGPSAAPPTTTTSTTMAPAPPAAPVEPTPAPEVDPGPPPTLAPAPEPPPAPAPADGFDPDGADPTGDRAFVVPTGAGARVVLRGDNLWSIAVEHLTATTGRTPDADQLRRYWAVLVEENRATLASGDPDVIYPGEVLRLPPLGP